MEDVKAKELGAKGFEWCPVCQDFFYHCYIRTEHTDRHKAEAACQIVGYRAGDLFAGLQKLPPEAKVYLPHVVNDEKKWGAGFVVPLGRSFPEARLAYLDWSPDAGGDDRFELGRNQIVTVRRCPEINVVNMCAQHGVGGQRPLRYNALVRCMDRLADRIEDQAEIICPLFGSGLAGGQWDFIERLIEDCWLRRGIRVTVFFLRSALPSDWTPPSITGRYG